MKGLAFIVLFIAAYVLFIAFYRRDVDIETKNAKVCGKAGMVVFVAIELFLIAGSLYLLFR